tara:strand:- start:340 stop:2607 length:2268 start_codon:yes stop_codon:yes gene_type:complete
MNTESKLIKTHNLEILQSISKSPTDKFVIDCIGKDLLEKFSNTNVELLIKNVWHLFCEQKTFTYSCYVFSQYMKTFANMDKNLVKLILAEVINIIKYSMNTEEMSTFNYDSFHPIHLNISFKNIVKYLYVNDQLDLLNTIPRERIYSKLLDELNVNSCSIFNTLYIYKREFENYSIKLSNRTIHIKDLFKEQLTYFELQQHLIKHSTENVFASKYNKSIETSVFETIKSRSEHNLKPFNEDITIQLYQDLYKIEFNEEQLMAITSTISEPISLIQGNAGTGKSTLSMCITNILLKRKEEVLFLTISAKARDVIKDKIMIAFGEHNSVKAMTISKFLAYPTNKKPSAPNIIIDEASMIGNQQLLTFLRCFKKRLVLMGDGKQILPVKQLGTPFLSLQNTPNNIIECYLNICYLTIVKRQTSENPLTKFIHNVVSQEAVNLKEYNGEKIGVFYKTIDETKYNNDFATFFVERDKYASSICCIKPAHFYKTSEHIHNELFKNEKPIAQRPKYMNDSSKVPQYIYVKDYVMRTTNELVPCELNSDGEVLKTFEIPNGTFGRIIDIDPFNNVKIVYDNLKQDDIPYIETIRSNQLFSDFQLGYCQSTHKFQGSEYSEVIFNMNNNQNLNFMGGKNIFYTSITRAKNLLIICGTKQDKLLINKMVVSEFALPLNDINVKDTSNTTYNPFISSIPILETFANKINESIFNKVIQTEPIKDEPIKDEPNTHIQCKCGSKIKNDKYCIEKHNNTQKHIKFISTN